MVVIGALRNWMGFAAAFDGPFRSAETSDL